MTDLHALAQYLREAEASQTNIAPLRDSISSAEDAYKIQSINTDLRVQNGARIVGRKVGLTNPAVQAQLGVDQPDYGTLFDDMEIPHGGEIAWNPGAQMRVEAEYAFLLKHDITDANPSMGQVMQAIDYVLPSLEIVGSRIANWDIQFVDTVADNGSSAFFTHGPFAKRLEDVDLLNSEMVLKKGDEVIGKGTGRACLSSPLNAVQWLARVMAKGGTPMRAGDIVLSGALAKMVDAEPGASYTASFEGLGETSVKFGDLS